MKPERPPVGQWHVVMRENFQDMTYDVYIERYVDEQGTREVLVDSDTIKRIPIGVQAPVWMKMDHKLAWNSDFFNIFKHVYVLKNDWQRWEDRKAGKDKEEPKPNPDKQFIVTVKDERKGRGSSAYGPHNYEAAKVLGVALQDLYRNTDEVTVELKELK